MNRLFRIFKIVYQLFQDEPTISINNITLTFKKTGDLDISCRFFTLNSELTFLNPTDLSEVGRVKYMYLHDSLHSTMLPFRTTVESSLEKVSSNIDLSKELFDETSM
jgi:hypothetical protein